MLSEVVVGRGAMPGASVVAARGQAAPGPMISVVRMASGWNAAWRLSAAFEARRAERILTRTPQKEENGQSQRPRSHPGELEGLPLEA